MTGTGRGADGERRAAVLEALRRAPGPLDVSQVVVAVGLAQSTARFHLEHLVAEGAVEVERDPAHRPGRPRLRYRPVPEVAVDRGAAMRRLAGILAASMDSAGADAADRAGRAWAAQVLQQRVASAHDLPRPTAPDGARRLLALAADVLDAEGFAPRPVEAGPGIAATQAPTALELRRCPYLDVATEHPRAVCGMHLGLLRGLGEGLDFDVMWELVPELGGERPCLVRLGPDPG